MTRPESKINPASGWPDSRRWLIVFFGLFGLFCLNVLLGKAAVQFDWTLPFLLGDVAEFLLLLVSVGFLVLAALTREQEGPDGGPRS